MDRPRPTCGTTHLSFTSYTFRAAGPRLDSPMWTRTSEDVIATPRDGYVNFSSRLRMFGLCKSLITLTLLLRLPSMRSAWLTIRCGPDASGGCRRRPLATSRHMRLLPACGQRNYSSEALGHDGRVCWERHRSEPDTVAPRTQPLRGLRMHPPTIRLPFTRDWASNQTRSPIARVRLGVRRRCRRFPLRS